MTDHGKPMTPDTPIASVDLDELERLERAATPGPMDVERRDDDCGYIKYIVHGGPKGEDFASCTDELDARARQNAALIAATRNALPALLAAARRLRELQGALEFLHDNGGIICKAVPVGQNPWPFTYGIDPVHAARDLGWKGTP